MKRAIDLCTLAGSSRSSLQHSKSIGRYSCSVVGSEVEWGGGLMEVHASRQESRDRHWTRRFSEAVVDELLDHYMHRQD